MVSYGGTVHFIGSSKLWCVNTTAKNSYGDTSHGGSIQPCEFIAGLDSGDTTQMWLTRCTAIAASESNRALYAPISGCTIYNHLPKTIYGTTTGGSGTYVNDLVNTVAPVASGSASVGNVLSVTDGTYTGGGTVTYAYQWKRDGAAISSATTSTYTTVEDDVGHTVTCAVTATNEISSATATSNGISVVAAGYLIDDDFTTGSLPTGYTLTRASSGTYIDSSGVMQTAATDVARFTHDPVSYAALGLMYEPQRTNRLPYSNSIQLWTSTYASVVADQINAPDGTLTADYLRESTSTQGQVRYQNSLYPSVDAATTYTLSTYVKEKEAELHKIQLGFSAQFCGGTSTGAACFDVTAGSGAVGALGSSVTSASISDGGNGYYRCSVVRTTTGTGTSSNGVFLGLTNNVDTATKDYSYLGASKGLYPAFAQCEIGSLTSYIPTSGSQATRYADQLTRSIPASVSTLRVTFDDDSTQDIDVTAYQGSSYTLTNTLNRFIIKHIRSDV